VNVLLFRYQRAAAVFEGTIKSLHRNHAYFSERDCVALLQLDFEKIACLDLRHVINNELIVATHGLNTS